MSTENEIKGIIEVLKLHRSSIDSLLEVAKVLDERLTWLEKHHPLLAPEPVNLQSHEVN